MDGAGSAATTRDTMARRSSPSSTAIADKSARRFLWVCILPVIGFLLLVSVVPTAIALTDSFREMNLSAVLRHGKFVGLTNYVEVLGGDTTLYHALLLTLLFVVTAVPVEFMLGLFLAMVLNREFRGRRVWVTILLLPTMVAPVVVGLIWDFLLMPNFGLFTYMMNQLGLLQGTPVFSDPVTAFAALVIVDVWEWTPFMMLFMLAGLLGMPQEPIEAAQIDGASAWRVFRRIQLPLLRPMIVVALMFRTIDASKTFDAIYVLTGGGPGDATELISLYAFRTGFLKWDLSNAAAICLVLGFFSLLAASIFYKILARQSAEKVP
jgi:multiple sugar transport system permease protein